MSPAPAGRASLVATLVARDLRSFARDRLWLALTPITLATVAVGFWLAPSQVDETIGLGIHPPAAAALMERMKQDDPNDAAGIVLVPFEDQERLVTAILGDLEDPSEAEEQVRLGLSFPDDLEEALRQGRKPPVTVHVTASVPEPLRRAFAGEVRELGFGMQAALAGGGPGEAVPVVLPPESEMVLGEDRTGDQVAMRDKLRPMMAILILLMATVATAGLVAVEIENRTVTAVLVTPVRPGDLVAAKATTGVLLGAGQAIAFLVVTAGFGPGWPVVLALLLLAALMMAALGVIAGTAGRDFMSTLFLSVVLIVPMTAPTFAALFPGSTSPIIAAMPSWGFTEALVGMLGYGRPVAELTAPILATVGWTVGLLVVALVLLRRRVEAL